MATETTNLKLKRPSSNEFFNIQDFNENADKIDQAFGNVASKDDFPTSLPADGGNADTVGNRHIIVLTQAAYDTLGTKDANTIYLTTT